MLLHSNQGTLVATIVDLAGTLPPAAQIDRDCIAYQPSFSTLNDKPNFGSSQLNTTGSSATVTGPDPIVAPTASSNTRPVRLIVTPSPVLPPVTPPVAEPFHSQPSMVNSGMAATKGLLAPPQQHFPARENTQELAPQALLFGQQSQLATEIHNLETRSARGSETLELRVRELQSQMDCGLYQCYLLVWEVRVEYPRQRLAKNNQNLYLPEIHSLKRFGLRPQGRFRAWAPRLKLMSPQPNVNSGNYFRGVTRIKGSTGSVRPGAGSYTNLGWAYVDREPQPSAKIIDNGKPAGSVGG
ncbi:hypothetical protein B0H16DRAFT_1470791 [Mycena metata]|uniref:Uncharacterized protein n=1 Tax=Mycena metata TaxID=1033252 RepID=A0AAD7HUS2_9AGAR|nr:hypothetical protein B0H16DRAFT_1470791 [Mycena metata]